MKAGRIRKVLVKSTIVTLLSVAGSLLAAITIVPALGGVVDGNALLMCAICPLLVAFPTSGHTFWQKERLRDAHRDLARAHAELAAAHRRLTLKAARDDMTGMLNRESFFAALDRTRRRKDRGILLLVDADHFKKINDNWGHLVGDEALRAIASAITDAVRTGDILGRIGGEEFGVFLVDASEKEAQRVAERIRRDVELILFLPGSEHPHPLSVSVGGTPCAQDVSVSNLMRAADKRLYDAKRAGRNRVVLDDACGVSAPEAAAA